MHDDIKELIRKEKMCYVFNNVACMCTFEGWKQWRIQEGCSRSKTEGCHKRVWKDWKELLEMLARS